MRIMTVSHSLFFIHTTVENFRKFILSERYWIGAAHWQSNDAGRAKRRTAPKVTVTPKERE
jgi:hypothetical protein